MKCSVDLLASPDAEVWRFAGEQGFVVVSADSDFFDLAARYGAPPKLVWLRHWDRPTRDAEYLLRREGIRISEFAADPESGILGLLIIKRLNGRK